MGQRLAGTCYITVDGEQLLLQGSLTANKGMVTREPLVANGRVVGYSEGVVNPHIDGTVYVPPGFPLKKLQDSTDMTVVAEFANGESCTLSGAWVANELDYSGQEGTLSITFNGEDLVWN